jgi:predicted metal-binding membrane protein
MERTQLVPAALCAILIAAGLYQFTSLKRNCLHHCRSPFAFVVRHWQEGRVGALLLGARHGLYCFGCCWALFTVLVAAGTMSLAWMALITLVVFIEKTLPIGRLTALVVGGVLMLLGSAVGAGAVPVGWFS